MNIVPSKSVERRKVNGADNNFMSIFYSVVS